MQYNNLRKRENKLDWNRFKEQRVWNREEIRFYYWRTRGNLNMRHTTAVVFHKTR